MAGNHDVDVAPDSLTGPGTPPSTPFASVLSDESPGRSFELPSRRFQVRAILAGERIDTRGIRGGAKVLEIAPLAIPVDSSGVAFLFPYGAIVFCNVDQVERTRLIGKLRRWIIHPFAAPAWEEVEVAIEDGCREGTGSNPVLLRDASLDRLNLLADVLGKSVLLDLYESQIAESFDRVEPLAVELESRGRSRVHGRELVAHLGRVLRSECRMVARAEVREKPELLWERDDLERLYARLVDEFEIDDRYLVLERKMDLISRTAQTLVNLEDSRRSLGLEWAIVALILVEIVLFLYELFIKAH